LPAFLNLGSNCGIRGLVFYYPSQKASMLVPETILEYPFTIRGTGNGIYIADCMLTNPYQAINLYEADNHLVEDPEQVKVIQKAKRMRNQGKTIRVIAEALNLSVGYVHKALNTNLKTLRLFLG